MAKQVIQVGAGVKCFINGVDYGFVIGIELENGSPRKPNYGIDQQLPTELIPTTVSTGGTVQVFRLISDGGLESRGITAGPTHIATENYFSLMLVDRQTDKVLYQANECSVDSQRWSIQARSIVTGTFTFHGLLARNNYTG